MTTGERLAWLIVTVLVALAVAFAAVVDAPDAGICIEGGEPPHCAGPGGPPRWER